MPSVRWLQELYELDLDYRQVLELDSSTAAKFSRHLVIRLPGHAFADNSQLGCFVASVLKARTGAPEEAAAGPAAAAADETPQGGGSLAHRLLLQKVRRCRCTHRETRTGTSTRCSCPQQARQASQTVFDMSDWPCC